MDTSHYVEEQLDACYEIRRYVSIVSVPLSRRYLCCFKHEALVLRENQDARSLSQQLDEKIQPK
jgi:hypothetical protein